MPCDALYLHIPFCQRKCPYCDFYSVPATRAQIEAYTTALLRALQTCPYPLAPLNTVYFGGGTPLLLGAERIIQLLDLLRQRFQIAAAAEITLECNPHSSLKSELVRLQRAGVNRISLGMQSANDQQLQELGRLHTAQDVLIAAQAAREAGIPHLSLDLMLATPGQTKQDVLQAIQLCDRAGAEHVSAYLLKVEEGTPFAAAHIERRCPDEEQQADLYLYAVEMLAQYGYVQYEISNFARDGKTARHNLKYWNCQEYLGVGPSAHSYYAGKRFYFPRRLGEFVENSSVWSLVEQDGAGGSLAEYLMLRLRLNEGVIWEQLAERFPLYERSRLEARAKSLPSQLLTCDEAGLRLTPEGFLVSNAILGTLLDF